MLNTIENTCWKNLVDEYATTVEQLSFRLPPSLRDDAKQEGLLCLLNVSRRLSPHASDRERRAYVETSVRRAMYRTREQVGGAAAPVQSLDRLRESSISVALLPEVGHAELSAEFCALTRAAGRSFARTCPSLTRTERDVLLGRVDGLDDSEVLHRTGLTSVESLYVRRSVALRKARVRVRELLEKWSLPTSLSPLLCGVMGLSRTAPEPVPESVLEALAEGRRSAIERRSRRGCALSRVLELLLRVREGLSMHQDLSRTAVEAPATGP